LLKNRKKRDVACEPNYRLKDSCMGRNTSEARFVTTALVTFSISTIVDYKGPNLGLFLAQGPAVGRWTWRKLGLQRLPKGLKIPYSGNRRT
jgi:hypothetical protein